MRLMPPCLDTGVAKPAQKTLSHLGPVPLVLVCVLQRDILLSFQTVVLVL